MPRQCSPGPSGRLNLRAGCRCALGPGQGSSTAATGGPRRPPSGRREGGEGDPPFQGGGTPGLADPGQEDPHAAQLQGQA